MSVPRIDEITGRPRSIPGQAGDPRRHAVGRPQAVGPRCRQGPPEAAPGRQVGDGHVVWPSHADHRKGLGAVERLARGVGTLPGQDGHLHSASLHSGGQGMCVRSGSDRLGGEVGSEDQQSVFFPVQAGPFPEAGESKYTEAGRAFRSRMLEMPCQGGFKAARPTVSTLPQMRLSISAISLTRPQVIGLFNHEFGAVSKEGGPFHHNSPRQRTSALGPSGLRRFFGQPSSDITTGCQTSASNLQLLPTDPAV